MGQSSTGTVTPFYVSDTDRLTQGRRIWRPDRRTDVGGQWDWWWSMTSTATPAGRLTTEQRSISARLMAADGDRPEDLATWTGFGGDVDAWADALLEADRADRRELARGVAAADRRRAADPLSAEYAAEWEAWDGDQLAAHAVDILGPQEIAQELGRTAACVHQWIHRGKLPPADARISGVPLWARSTLAAAEILP